MEINVTYHAEDGSWWAESAGLPGFTAVADDFAGVRELVLEAVAEAAPGAAIVPSYEVENTAMVKGGWASARPVATGAQVADHSPARVRTASARPLSLPA